MNIIIDLITSIRNAKNAKLGHIAYSVNQKERLINIVTILSILRTNGVIRAFSYVSNKKSTQFVIFIKYDQTGNSVIRSIFNVSKPSRKLYISSKAL
jgi:ribosomal protein S8